MRRFLLAIFMTVCLANQAREQSVPNPDSPINQSCSATNPMACTVWTPLQWIGAWQSKMDYPPPQAQGPILGVYPNLYFAPSPGFTGIPTVTNGTQSQIEFVRQNGSTGGFTFVGSTSVQVGISSSEVLPIEFANNGYQVRMYIDPTFGNVGIGTTTPSSRLDVVGQTITLEQPFTPAHNTTACTTGQIAWDTSYVYVCTATNTWNRTAYTAGSW